MPQKHSLNYLLSSSSRWKEIISYILGLRIFTAHLFNPLSGFFLRIQVKISEPLCGLGFGTMRDLGGVTSINIIEISLCGLKFSPYFFLYFLAIHLFFLQLIRRPPISEAQYGMGDRWPECLDREGFKAPPQYITVSLFLPEYSTSKPAGQTPLEYFPLVRGNHTWYPSKPKCKFLHVLELGFFHYKLTI